GRLLVGVPVPLGLVSGDQLCAVAELAESCGGDVRITRQQNLVITGLSDLGATERALSRAGLPLDAGTLRGDAIACTGEPHCNFSVTETKTRMDGLVQLLETRFGESLDGLRLHLDGCAHAGAQPWARDLG